MTKMLIILVCYSGAQGEYTGLRSIKAYLESIDQPHRKVNMALMLTAIH